MNRFILLALLANTWAHAQDGVYLADTAAGARAIMDKREVVVRFPVIRTAAPKAKCILLVDSQARSQLTNTPKGLVLVDTESVSKSECIMHVILDKPLPEEPVRVVVLGDLVFWDVHVSRSREAGWMSFPVDAVLRGTQCLWNAGRVFGVEDKHVFDLRLTDEERARPAEVQGQLSTRDIAEIRQTVFAMARQQILEGLAGRIPEAWPELLQKWPGRRALDISVSEHGRDAAVYYAPNAGYQMEKIDGKWTIVGG
jgi:hypothetical protein